MAEPLYLPPFAAPKLKFNRAREHLLALGALINDYWNSRPIAVAVEMPENFPASLGMHALVARVREFLPLSASAIIGDIIHNLRSALDLMACDLVRLNGKDPADVYFPFCKDAESLPRTIKSKNFDRASAAAVAELTKLAPYAAGNRALRALHDLDIQDKHRTIIPTIMAMQAPSFTVLIGYHANTIAPFHMTITNFVQNLIIFPETHDLPVDCTEHCIFRIVFTAGDPYEGFQVVETLHAFTQLVHEIIDSFELLSIGSDGKAIHNPGNAGGK